MGVFLSFTFCSCGKKEQTSKITIRFATWETMPEQRRFNQKVVESFEKEYPNVDVKLEFVQGGTQKIITETPGVQYLMFFTGTKICLMEKG